MDVAFALDAFVHRHRGIGAQFVGVGDFGVVVVQPQDMRMRAEQPLGPGLGHKPPEFFCDAGIRADVAEEGDALGFEFFDTDIHLEVSNRRRGW